mmetsp:Transcript_21603/g.46544  ORF Transcript_21603/g.46544 Transcript_21603/m.46544 type:complete len:271 (-) Transcript_21603:174-986(-)
MTSRPRDIADEDGDPVKRFKVVMNDMADEWLCPITCELPIDPVIAEDGRTYERSAIEAHIHRQGDRTRSPMTNQPMGARLVPNLQGKSTIECLVRTDAVSPDKITLWKERMKSQKEVRKVHLSAEAGDTSAMGQLAKWYLDGDKNLIADEKLAYSWYKRGADLMDPYCLRGVGFLRLSGRGVEKNLILGVSFVTHAAVLGDSISAFSMASTHTNGKYGFPRDSVHGRYWLNNALHNKQNPLPQRCLVTAKKLMLKLEDMDEEGDVDHPGF